MLCIIQNKNILIVLYDLFLRKIIIKCEAQSTVTGLQLKSCVAGPDSDPKDPHNFCGSGSIIFSKDLDPNPNPDPNSDLEIAPFTTSSVLSSQSHFRDPFLSISFFL